MKALDSMRRLTLCAAIFGGWTVLGCDAATDVKDCSALSRKLEGQLRTRCVGTPETPPLTSNYCSACIVGANLYSYTKSGDGVCVCTPLTFTDDSCAGVDDSDKITSAIVAADNECAEFRVANASSAAGGNGAGGGTGDTAGTSGMSGSGG